MARWEPASVRFWKNVDRQEGGCWVWTAAKASTGYGCFHDKRPYRTHRYSWLIHNGPIPAGLLVLHKCDNRLCINPDHLFLGTHAENSQDMVNKGRSKGPNNAGEKHGESKLTDAAVREIRESPLKGRELAAKFGVSESAVSMVRRGKSWTHVV